MHAYFFRGWCLGLQNQDKITQMYHLTSWQEDRHVGEAHWLYTEPRPRDEESGHLQLRCSYYLTVTSCYLLLVQPQIISWRPSPLSLRRMQKMPGGGRIVLKSTYLNALFGWKHLLLHHNWPSPYVFLFAGWNVQSLLNVKTLLNLVLFISNNEEIILDSNRWVSTVSFF